MSSVASECMHSALTVFGYAEQDTLPWCAATRFNALATSAAFTQMRRTLLCSSPVPTMMAAAHTNTVTLHTLCGGSEECMQWQPVGLKACCIDGEVTLQHTIYDGQGSLFVQIDRSINIHSLTLDSLPPATETPSPMQLCVISAFLGRADSCSLSLPAFCRDATVCNGSLVTAFGNVDLPPHLKLTGSDTVSSNSDSAGDAEFASLVERAEACSSEERSSLLESLPDHLRAALEEHLAWVAY